MLDKKLWEIEIIDYGLKNLDKIYQNQELKVLPNYMSPEEYKNI